MRPCFADSLASRAPSTGHRYSSKEIFLERCEGGCLARDDFRNAKKYRDDEQLRAVGVKLGGLKWMREKGFISEEEYGASVRHIEEKKRHKASGDPDPGGSTGPASAVDRPAPAPRPKLEKEDEE